VLVIAGVVVATSVPPLWDDTHFQKLLHWPFDSSAAHLSSHLATWDSPHYLRLAQEGYVSGSPSCAFYPLLPALIRGCGVLVGGRPLLGGLILVNVLSVAALLLFHALVERYHGRPVANMALTLLVAFPGAVFFHFIYTESLFLLLLVLFFRSLLAGDFSRASVVAFFLPLTKAIGVFCLAPLAVELWRRKRPWWDYIWMVLPLLGYATYFGIMFTSTGNPMEGFEAQRFYPNQPSVQHVFDLIGAAYSFLDADDLHSQTSSTLDRLFFLVFAASLYPIWKLNKTYFAYAFFAGTVPAFASWYVSYTRNVMMCLPLFIVLSIALERCKERWLVYYWVALLAAAQGFLLFRFVNFRWAG